MDKFGLIRIFSNGERFVKRQQEHTPKGTMFTFDMKNLDRKLRKKSFSFLCRRGVDEIQYINFFVEDSSENYLAARVYNEKFLWDCINS